MEKEKNKELWVCWDLPLEIPKKRCVILSFLRPSVEDKLLEICGQESVISGRRVAQRVKDAALNIYINMVARIGSEKIFKGKSLRQLLKTKDGNSLWWYHRVSFKDCEADPTFNKIIQILTIKNILEEGIYENVVFWFADEDVTKSFEDNISISVKKVKKDYVFPLIMKALGSRILKFFQCVYHWYIIKQYTKEIEFKPDVILQGFWDWSVRLERDNKRLADRVFMDLPETLKQHKFKVAWYLWFDPNTEPKRSSGSQLRVLKKALSFNNIIFLHYYLTFIDIIKTYANFSPLIKYVHIFRLSSFRELFRKDGSNFYPLFKRQLVYHFLSNTIPHLMLIEISSNMMAKRLQPSLSINFLELFPYSRAFYAGAKRGNPRIILCAMQHASYNREKTFVALDPIIEYHGKEDNCAVPKPDYIFTMGEIGKKIFEEAGFASHCVMLTGSARYNNVRVKPVKRLPKEETRVINLLLVTSLDTNLEMDMVEAACTATKELKEIRLYLRKHPFGPIDRHPLFKTVSDRIIITMGTLEEDLQIADLILFSYSTVAEEAFIRGIPVWQWCGANYNGSIFRDIKVIPQFTTVSGLRESLKAFIENPEKFKPTAEEITRVVNACFYRTDGDTNYRIVCIIKELLKGDPHLIYSNAKI